MGKKKDKSRASKRGSKTDEFIESNEHFDGLEMDDADEYEAMQDSRIMSKLSAMSKKHNVQDVSGGFEELYALSGDSDSDEDIWTPLPSLEESQRLLKEKEEKESPVRPENFQAIWMKNLKGLELFLNCFKILQIEILLTDFYFIINTR